MKQPTLYLHHISSKKEYVLYSKGYKKTYDAQLKLKAYCILSQSAVFPDYFSPTKEDYLTIDKTSSGSSVVIKSTFCLSSSSTIDFSLTVQTLIVNFLLFASFSQSEFF